MKECVVYLGFRHVMAISILTYMLAFDVKIFGKECHAR